MSTSDTTTAPQGPAAAPPPTPLVAFAILVIVTVALVGWVVIASQFLSEVSFFGGFLMLWYWANVDELSVHKLPKTLLGALVGIGLAWVLLYGGTNYGLGGLLAGLALLLFALYLDIMKAVPLFINSSTMLFVTVAAAPLVQRSIDWTELCLSTVLGGLFFAAFVEGAKRLAARFQPG